MNDVMRGDRPVVLGLVSEFPPPAAGMTVAAETMRRRMTADGVDVVPVVTNPQFRGVFRPLGRVRFVRGAIAWCRFMLALHRVFRVDLLHVFASSWLNFFLFAAPAVIAGRLSRRAVVVHYHGGSAADFLGRWSWLAMPVLRAAHRVVVPSEFLAQVFATHGLDVEIIANPVDTVRVAVDPHADPVVLSCRNLSPVYDIETAIDAFSRLADVEPNARMLIAGDGPDRAALESQASACGLADRIEFLGNVEHDHMVDVRKRSTVVLNTSRADNQPVSLLEAMAAGLPIVSTDAGGIPDLVGDGVEALLAPVGDVDALGAQLIRVCADPVVRDELIDAGRERARAYRWRTVAEQWYRLYGELWPAGVTAAAIPLDTARQGRVRS